MVKGKEKANKKPRRQEKTWENLRMAAYYHWLEGGCPMGDGLTGWMEVERKYAARHN